MRAPYRTLIADATTPDREPLTLTLEAGHHVVRVRGELLMSNRVSGSEEALATLALGARPPHDARVLIGGLGMGFTLRAVLDALGSEAKVQVLELLAAVVEWNCAWLASHAGHPLDDPRAMVIVRDVVDHLARDDAGRYDAIILDIDNGPEAFTVKSNQRLYQPAGLALLYEALRPGGTLVLWSAFRSPPFEKRLRSAGFAVETVTVRARGTVRKGARHTVFKARRPDE